MLTQLRIPDLEHPRYVRGCSGFAGFARGNNRRIATAFSQAVSTLVGPQRWKEWGTEQVTSNFVIANNDNARVLPPASYINYWGSPPSADVRFLHFVGTYRSEEHTSELQSLMRISYAVFCLKKKKKTNTTTTHNN